MVCKLSLSHPEGKQNTSWEIASPIRSSDQSLTTQAKPKVAQALWLPSGWSHHSSWCALGSRSCKSTSLDSFEGKTAMGTAKLVVHTNKHIHTDTVRSQQLPGISMFSHLWKNGIWSQSLACIFSVKQATRLDPTVPEGTPGLPPMPAMPQPISLHEEGLESASQGGALHESCQCWRSKKRELRDALAGSFVPTSGCEPLSFGVSGPWMHKEPASPGAGSHQAFVSLEVPSESPNGRTRRP